MNGNLYDSQLFAELYDVQPQAIIWMRPIWSEEGNTITDFEYTYCNEEGLKYLNINREQQRGLRISNTPTLTDELRVNILEEMTGVYQTGAKSETYIYNQALNKYARVLRTRLRDGVLSVVQDRTEEQLMIRQLEDQKQLLDNILKYSSNGISVTEAIRDEGGQVIDARTILANDAAVRFTGLPRDVYLNKTAVEIEPNIISSYYYHLYVKTLETGEPSILQYHMEHTGRWLELSISRMDKDHVIHIFTDVTAIKEAQLALEHSASKLQTIINRSQSGVFTVTPERNERGEIYDFRFVMVNNTLASYVHQNPEALIGEPGSKWFTGYKANGLFDLFCDTYVNNRMNRFDFHYNADGIDAWIDMMCTRFDEEVLITFTDYTPIKQLQLQLEQKVAELKRSNADLEDFAYAASHDLKEPLRKITIYCQRLQKELLQQLNETQQKMFERMESASERMSHLISDLLAYAQLGNSPDVLQAVVLEEIVQQVLQDLEALIIESEAMVNIESLPEVNGSERQLRQLFQNLIGNALKYRKPHVSPVISISSRKVTGIDPELGNIAVSREGSYYLIEVSDNGIGFDPKYAKEIFQVFHRLHTGGKYEGTGVGLAIVRKVVSNHNGYIWAEGKPNEGSRFKVLLPVSD